MIDNTRMEALLAEYRERRADYDYAVERGWYAPYPKFPEEVGAAFIELASKLANRPNFRGYGFRDDMIGDAYLNFSNGWKNFDPKKGRFSTYFLHVAWNAFIKRIKREARETEKIQRARELAERYGLIGVEDAVSEAEEAA